MIETALELTHHQIAGKGIEQILTIGKDLLQKPVELLPNITEVLEQLQELTEDEKKDLLNILNRSSLSNVVKTIKEIDHRLDVLNKLKFLIDEKEKETLEVKHLQKIWIASEESIQISCESGKKC